MGRVYRNVHIALIAALVLLAVAFEATAGGQLRASLLPPEGEVSGRVTP